MRRLSCRRWCMNGEMEGRGDLKLWDALLLNGGKLRTYPPFKIPDITSVGDRTVISHLPIFAGNDFGRGEGVFPPTVGAHGV